MSLCHLIDAIVDELLVDIDRDNLAKHQPAIDGLAMPVPQADYVDKLAFHL